MVDITEINQDLKRLKECLHCACVLELIEHAEKLEQVNDILSQALKELATPLEYKAVMLEIESLRETNEEG